MSQTGFAVREYLGTTYSLFVPHAYEPSRKWPCIVFLHGAGETGDDGERQTTVGLGHEIRKNEASFPCIVLFPQSRQRSWMSRSADAQAAVGMLEQVMRHYSIDAARVHLTGISMGGYGTWSLAAAYPDRWASLVVVCGGGDPLEAPKIKHIPAWFFHGDADSIIPVEQSRQLVGSLRSAGAEPKYTEYSGVGHNCWDLAYATPELWDWLRAQRRA